MIETQSCQLNAKWLGQSQSLSNATKSILTLDLYVGRGAVETHLEMAQPKKSSDTK